MKKKKNVWDEGRWANQEEISFDYMTYNIFEKIKKRIKIKKKNFIELGSGLGRLSYLCAKNFANKIILVDNSEKAIALTKKYPELKNNLYVSNFLNFFLYQKIKPDIIILSDIS